MRSKRDLTEGPIFKGLLLFALPILLGTVVTSLYHVADSVVVGQMIGKDALAAVNAGSPVMSFLNMFLIGLSTGSNVVIAQRMGTGDRARLQRAIGTVACLTLIVSGIIMTLGLVFANPILDLLGTPDEIRGDAGRYLLIIYLGTFGNMVYQMGSGALRGMGDSAMPFFFLLLCSVLNVVLDVLAVSAGLGVAGVAIATSLSQLISGIGVVLRINRGGYGVKLMPGTIKLDPVESKRIISIGLPAAIQNVGNAVANVCVQSSVNYFGTDFIAGNSIVNKADEFVNIPVMALSTALCTFTGQNAGKKDLKRIKKGIDLSIVSLSVLGVFTCGGLILLRNYFPHLFTTDGSVTGIAAQGLFIFSFTCLFHGIDRVLVNAMRGLGKSWVPMVTAQFGAFSRIPLAYFLGVRRNDPNGIFLALTIASFLRTLAIAVYYFCVGMKNAEKNLEKTDE